MGDERPNAHAYLDRSLDPLRSLNGSKGESNTQTKSYLVPPQQGTVHVNYHMGGL